MNASKDWLAVVFAITLLGGCAHQPETVAEQQARIHVLTNDLHTMSPGADARKTQQFAATAVNTAARLRDQYGVRFTPWMHNIEVNSGTKTRGLCFHYAKDLAAALQPLAAPDWQLYIVQANPDGILEHNAIVVVDKGKPWDSGIVLDGWRDAGILYFGPVPQDRYPWQLKGRIGARAPITTSDHPGS